jgi:hypothetical protein
LRSTPTDAGTGGGMPMTSVLPSRPAPK